MTEIEDSKCVVDIQTLSFRPTSGEWLQMARRGKRFIPGNIRRRQWTGKVKDTELDSERGDVDITIDNSPYNEWLAVQGLLNLSEDQSKEGDICNLHGDSNKDKEKSDANEDDVTNKQNQVVIQMKMKTVILQI